jgi:hypothetical protein
MCYRYHQKIPDDPPELELKATYGLVSPNEVPLPSPSPLWTPASYAAFDTPKASTKDPANSVCISVIGTLFLYRINCISWTESSLNKL